MNISVKSLSLSLMAALMLSSIGYGQGSSVAAQPNTFWRFMGIPQGIQKIRDVSVNRRGNRPELERKPPMKRIADPLNLESDNPAIKTAAEIKQAEDMKAQKIKAIKYLATIGCGCYDKDGKITEALLAATDDCTPDVRLAAVEAVEQAMTGQSCRKCGSTSCCNEKITKRLSEMAYERDDSGCPVEPSAEIRCAAKRVLCKCCPGRVPPGMIEEDYEVEDAESLPTPPAEEPKIQGESASEEEGIKGESSDAAEELQSEAAEADAAEAILLNDANDFYHINDAEAIELLLSQYEMVVSSDPQVLVIGGMPVKPTSLQPISEAADERPAKLQIVPVRITND